MTGTAPMGTIIIHVTMTPDTARLHHALLNEKRLLLLLRRTPHGRLLVGRASAQAEQQRHCAPRICNHRRCCLEQDSVQGCLNRSCSKQFPTLQLMAMHCQLQVSHT